MAEKTKSYFEELSSIDLRGREQIKPSGGGNSIRIIPWAVAYSEIMKYDPDATYEFLREKKNVTEVVTVQTEDGEAVRKSITYTQELPFFDLGIGFEVRTRMTVKGITKEMSLPVYNSQNKSMGAEPRTYTTKRGENIVDAALFENVYNSMMRCLAKNCAMFGIGINLWSREDAPESVMELERLRTEAFNLFAQKAALSNNTKLKVNEIAKSSLPEECNSDPRLCEDIDILKELIKKFKAVRLIPDEAKETKTTNKK